MKYWNRKNKIEFFHNEPSIIDNFPIIKSKELKFNWVNKLKKDFQNHVKAGDTELPGFTHISRCPGIFDLFKYGYIVTLHKDVIIIPDGGSFKWTIPAPRESNLDISEMLPREGIFVQKPPWAADFIIKIRTGWHVIVPKGIKFLILPIAYPDTFDFTSTIGIFDPAIGTEVNFQMYWNERTENQTLIKAGTPLGHLIPLTEKKYQMVQRTMNQRDFNWTAKLYNTYNSTFWRVTMRNVVANMYNKYWKR